MGVNDAAWELTELTNWNIYTTVEVRMKCVFASNNSDLLSQSNKILRWLRGTNNSNRHIQFIISFLGSTLSKFLNIRRILHKYTKIIKCFQLSFTKHDYESYKYLKIIGSRTTMYNNSFSEQYLWTLIKLEAGCTEVSAPMSNLQPWAT